MSNILRYPTPYCVVNTFNGKVEFRGRFDECWDALMMYKSRTVENILDIGWRIVPARAAQNLKQTVAA